MTEEEKKKAMLPTNDYVFKRIFGYEGKEEITKDFIEAVTKYEIEEIDVGRSTILEKDLIRDKIGVLDVRAVINNNVQVDIEMQVMNQDNVEERILFYWSKLYNQSIREGERYKQLRKTIVILVTNFKVEKLKEIEKYHTEFKIREREYSQVILTEALEIHIVELPKVKEEIERKKDKEKEEESELLVWAKFLINPEKMGEEEMNKHERVKEAREIIKYLKKDEKERELAEQRLMYIMDQNAIESYGYRHGREAGYKEGKETGYKEGKESGYKDGKEKGREEGRKEGMQQGAKENSKKIAKTMKEKGLGIKLIQDITKLTEKEIKEI